MEFLLEAIGEIDARLIVGVVVSMIVAVVRPLLGAFIKWLHGLGDRRAREADASGPGLARPQPLSSHREPGNRPARPFQGSTPEKLAGSMRCFGRVPISHYRHRRWLVAFWRAVKLYLLPAKTLPKSAFTAVDWRRLENQAQGDWKGGTDECLVVGRLLRRGPSLRPKQWAQHCDQALPQ